MNKQQIKEHSRVLEFMNVLRVLKNEGIGKALRLFPEHSEFIETMHGVPYLTAKRSVLDEFRQRLQVYEDKKKKK